MFRQSGPRHLVGSGESGPGGARGDDRLSKGRQTLPCSESRRVTSGLTTAATYKTSRIGQGDVAQEGMPQICANYQSVKAISQRKLG